jgi:hypothetical protein
MNARSSDPQTSHDAAAIFSKKVGRVDARIVELTRAAGKRGISQAEIVDALPEYKPGSITPRFARLVKRGLLVRLRIGTGNPSKRFPDGRPLHKTRVDGATHQRVLLHWVPEFAPSGIEVEISDENKPTGVQMKLFPVFTKWSAGEHMENSTLDELDYDSFESHHDSEWEYNG